ncbi:uncharacterized protein LOC119685821 [Teleopsis dalmanni]|uniref:uncharacterized protein LOC119685821 n=1 Tax=Teleopsis dalmanni TaxID=139649 RepID=UPI0018CEB671|nr:uncharacterized protein LOC119685821 [Teleopsis dalmanni]
MTSGEWDLRALKALEEEEQKEFLALSQKSLFEPPSPPAGTQSTTKQSLSYAQLHPHLLKLPTINEYNLIAKRNQQNANSTGRLKFTRALSLSAHSLTGRGSGCAGGGASSKKSKRKCAASKSIGSLSPPQYSASPVYTPPPVRRCATLHYTQPVRKTFKTLQQLEKQKQEKKKEAALKNHKSPQLQRVAGTNKTFWKYGANSTAASIIGQRSLLKLKKQSADLESNTSDEVGSEEANTTESATDTGSCTVPFATDSIEMMRLMLSAATTAVTTQPAAMAALDYLNPPPDIAAGATSGTELNDYSKFANNQFLTLSHYPTHIPPLEPNETVAYEAFQTFSRGKSFSGRHGGATLVRGSSLIEEQHVDRDNSAAILTRNVNGRKMLKATSVDTPGVEYAGGIQPTTIITNPIVEGIKTSTASKLSHMCHLTKTKAQTNLLPTAMVGLRFHDNPHNTNMHHQQQHHVAAMLCQDITSNNSSSNSPPNAIDDELEQHIKHCSCSCNHMGYGNSMDYQVSMHEWL